MKICCCDIEAPSGRNRSSCPVDGSKGDSVKKTTVAAMTLGPVPSDTSFYICRSPACSVVYFGSGGTVFTTDQVRVVPGFKEGGTDLVCYCFEHTESALVEEVTLLGRSSIQESIESQVKQGNCACEVRNPDGKCCLKQIKALVADTQQTRRELA